MKEVSKMTHQTPAREKTTEKNYHRDDLARRQRLDEVRRRGAERTLEVIYRKFPDLKP